MTDSLSIALVGDVYMGPDLPENIVPSLRETFARADLVVANQEGPICDDAGGGRADKCCLRSAPGAADALAEWGVDVVSLANNHMFDFGWEGFEQTCRELDRVGIRYLRAGKDVTQARRPLLIERKGVKIGLLAYSWSEVQTTCATEDTFGCAPLDPTQMLTDVTRLRRDVDVVVVLPHWGYCDYRCPTPEHHALGRKLIDAGAMAVVGSHSHVLQGLLRHGDGVVMFGLGDFAFAPFVYKGRASEFSREKREAGILTLEVKGNRIVSDELHFTTRRNGVIMLDPSPSRAKSFACRSQPLAEPDYPRHWRRVVRRRLLRRALYWANVMNWRNLQKESLIGVWTMLTNAFRRRAT